MSAFDFLRLSVFLAALGPLARLVWLGYGDGLTANPIEFVTRSTGTWALVFLCLSLSITPLRRLTGQSRWMKLRRMLGLYSFFYALLHFTLWFWIDQELDFMAMGQDVLKRPFIAAGFLAFVLLLALAATSTRGMMRRLGKSWSRLHRLVYLVAVAVILHYWWHKSGKNDYETVQIYAALVALLLGLRVWWSVQDRQAGGLRYPAKGSGGSKASSNRDAAS
jgi:methionine sulfoxide reductase heme-binding subunit